MEIVRYFWAEIFPSICALGGTRWSANDALNSLECNNIAT